MTGNPYLKVPEAAELLGIGVSTLRRYATRKDCPVVKHGQLFFHREKLLNWWGSKNF